MTGRYDDIINRQRYITEDYPNMPLSIRAAQFSPFAALTGYDDYLREQERITDRRPEVSEDERERFDKVLSLVLSITDGRAVISVTFFLPDDKKSGGSIIEHSGIFKTADTQRRLIIFEDGTEIFAGDIINITVSPMSTT